MRYFCTYFDQHYLSRGLALYRSMCAHCPDFQLWILCMDDVAYRILAELKLPRIHPIALETFEQGDAPLAVAKANRSRIEYYFTCTPSLPLYVFKNHPEVDLITYLDADLFLFADPTPVFDEMGACSIAIIGHRFPSKIKKEKEVYGKYNVGWLSFRKDADGHSCLNWWRESCIEWCYDRLEGHRFADQKYLDDWPTRFRKVIVLEHKGANLAPWNVSNYQLRYDRHVTVDGQALIFFHFHGLKQVTPWRYNPGWEDYQTTPSQVLRKRVYAPYLKTLFEVNRQLRSASNLSSMSGLKRKESNQSLSLLNGMWKRKDILMVRGVVI